MSTEETTETVQASLPSSPGRLLADARESSGLTQKEVADKLHITVHYVRSIEQDTYEKLPAAIFAKGYIKRYAEILDLDIGEVLETFEHYQQDQQDQRNEVTRIHARKNRARNRNFAIASVLAFVALFVGLWAWNMMSVDEAPVVDTRGRADVIGDRIASVMEQEETQSRIESEALTVSGSSLNEPNNQGVEQAAVQVLDSSSSDQAASLIAETVETVSMPSTTKEQDVNVISISNEGNDVLRVSFDDDSFIQVSDELSNRIYRGTLGRGEVLEITADGPFDILIGDAPLTHITLNGTEVDVMESIRVDNSARLTVGL